MLIILIAQSVFIIHTIGKSDLPFLIKDRIVSFEYIFLFIEIILGIILFFYMPLVLQKNLRPIEKVFNEISRGKLDIAIPENIKKGPISSFIHSTNLMIENLKDFDEAKRKKIIENRQRLDAIAENTDDGIIIINGKAEIALINQHARKLLGISSVEDSPPLLDFHFEGEVLKYFEEAVAKKMLIPEQKVYFPKIKKHITFRNSILHDKDGGVSGMVIIIADIDLKKLYEPAQKEDIKPKQKS
jgi:PAS domain S-box-containing protein